MDNKEIETLAQYRLAQSKIPKSFQFALALLATKGYYNEPLAFL